MQEGRAQGFKWLYLLLPLRHNTKITIHILPDGELLGKYNGKYYKMEEFHKPEPVSKQAERIEAKGPREPYKPGPDQEVYYKIKF